MRTAALYRRRRFGGSAAPDPLAAYAANGVNPALVADFQEDMYLGTISAFSDFTESGTSFDTVVGSRRLLVDQTAGDTLALAAANVPEYTTSFCIQITGEITYANNGINPEAKFYDWQNGAEYVRLYLTTQFASTGTPYTWQNTTGSGLATRDAPAQLTPGTNVPFNLCVRHGSTFLQIATAGTASAVNATPTAIADLSSVNMNFVSLGVMRLRSIIIWNQDIGQAGIEGASSPDFFT